MHATTRGHAARDQSRQRKDLLTIEKDRRRFYAQYNAASQTGPYMAHIEGEHATPAIPAHTVAKLADREA